jgi:hypothetical protein
MLGFFWRAYTRYWERQRAEQRRLESQLGPARESLGLTEKPPAVGCQHRYAFGHYCGRSQLSESNFCFWHHRDRAKYSPEVIASYFGEGAYLKDAIEREIVAGNSLSDAYLEDAAIGGDWFQRGADLSNADLRGADLRGMHLSYGSLRNANLALANLEDAYLSDVVLDGTTFTRAKLYRVKFRDNDFSRVKGLEKNSFRNWGRGIVPRYRILEDYPDQAGPVYRELTAYFSRIGALEDASWAAYRCKLMRHRILRKRLTLGGNVIEAAVDDNIRHLGIDPQRVFEVGLSAWLSTLIEFFKSGLYWLIFGYGEKPLRVAMLSLEVIVMYAAIYASMNALTVHGFWAALYFSIVTFTTLGYGDVTPTPNFRLMAASEAVAGLLLSGLFLFTLSRRAIGRS